MASRNVALGRGLDALFEGVTGSEDSEKQVSGSMDVAAGIQELQINAISPNPYQPRRQFDEDALTCLAQTIEQYGIIQPITVRRLDTGGFEVISGERRLRAARRAGLQSVPAYVRSADMKVMLEMALVENIQREDLNPVEIAMGYQQLVSECGLRQEEVAQRVGKTRSTVANFLRLLRLPVRIQAALRDRFLSVGHARALITVRDENAQLHLLDEIVQKDLSVREVERRVQRIQQQTNDKKRSQEPAKKRQFPQLVEFENVLRKRFGTKVQLKHSANGGGKIEVHYFSNDDLERVLELLLRTT